MTLTDFKNPNQAFNEAVQSGRLSRDPKAPNFIGHYMYMGTWDHHDHFKHSLTRQYLK